MGQVTVAFKMPTYNVQVRVAEELAKPVEQVDPSGDKQPGQSMEDPGNNSIIKKEEIHKIIDDNRKTVEKLSVEETADGKQKVMILVAPAPILRSQPQPAPAAAPAPAAPAAATASPAPSVMPKQSPAPVSMASAKKKEVKTASAFKLPDAFMKAMGY